MVEVVIYEDSIWLAGKIILSVIAVFVVLVLFYKAITSGTKEADNDYE